jgi:hypothetical protein
MMMTPGTVNAMRGSWYRLWMSGATKPAANVPGNVAGAGEQDRRAVGEPRDGGLRLMLQKVEERGDQQESGGHEQ